MRYKSLWRTLQELQRAKLYYEVPHLLSDQWSLSLKDSLIHPELPF